MSLSHLPRRSRETTFRKRLELLGSFSGKSPAELQRVGMRLLFREHAGLVRKIERALGFKATEEGPRNFPVPYPRMAMALAAALSTPEHRTSLREVWMDGMRRLFAEYEDDIVALARGLGVKVGEITQVSEGDIRFPKSNMDYEERRTG